MDQAMKDRWENALRSGDYDQISGKLRSQREDGSIGYCCLGVLKDLNGVTWTTGDDVDTKPLSQRAKEFVENHAEKQTITRNDYFAAEDLEETESGYFELDSMFTFLSPLDMENWGLSKMTADKLVELNDSGEADFDSIADWIHDHDLTEDE